MIRRSLLVCLLLVGISACSDDDRFAAEKDQEPVDARTNEAGRVPLDGFGEVAAVITAADGTECEVCLLAARDPEQHSRGLMFVTDETLGGYDGMVFIFDKDAGGGFWMRNTRLPLSIAYFDGAGALVSQADMEPCPDEEETCPSYPAENYYRYVLEVPQGKLPDVGVYGPEGPDGAPAEAGEATMELTGDKCPELDAA